MSIGYEGLFLTRWVIFLLRIILYFAYGVLNFISKPGSRVIMPLVFAGFLWWQRDTVSLMANYFIYGFEHHGPASPAQQSAWLANPYAYLYPWQVVALAGAVVSVFALAYVLLSFILSLVLGALPRITRPLAPQRRLRPTTQFIPTARASSVVPPLPK